MSNEETETETKINLDSEQKPNKRRRRRRRRKRSSRTGKTRERLPSLQSPERQRQLLNKPFNYPSVNTPNNAATRDRYALTNAQLSGYLSNLSETILKALYSALGGQPTRVSSLDRLIQLTVRALKQESRMEAFVKTLHPKDRRALVILMHCGGLGHHKALIEELILSLGGSATEWTRTLNHLGSKGIVTKTETKNGSFFYVIPPVLMPYLVEVLAHDLSLPLFEHNDLRIIDHREFNPSLDFSLMTLITYISQRPLQLTQQASITKSHQDELDKFFHQLWEASSDLFNFHITFLMQQGIVEYRDNSLNINHSVVEEWIHLGPLNQRKLLISKLDRDFPLVEWILWILNEAGDKWIAEKPLQNLYRCWRRGDDWRQVYASNDWEKLQANRDTYSFANLISQGILELGTWGSEKFYRLSPRTKALVTAKPEEVFQQFYLMPSFDIVAPAGLPLEILYQIGELAELQNCDRTNSYKVTEHSIESALKRGWKRESILSFFRTHSQIGLPENVEQTIRGWAGTQGDVEFHEATLLFIHRSQIKRFESSRQYKPYVLHRFTAGLYAIDVSRKDELKELLRNDGFHLNKTDYTYLNNGNSAKVKSLLHEQLLESQELQNELFELEQSIDIQPQELEPLKKKIKESRKKRSSLPPRTSPKETRVICEQAISEHKNLKVLYVTKTQERRLLQLTPERIAVTPSGNQVLVATDQQTQQRLSYNIVQIERIQSI
ncbi:MAG: helicase-associated domain-containing protein [Myxococcota bacterium]|nr:helicase-associated domain-containing protein [Myxococcota bacterium]